MTAAVHDPELGGLYAPAALSPHLPPRTVAFGAVAVERLRGLLIDLDDTLYRYAPCHEAGLAAAYAHDPLGLDWPDYATRYRAAREAVTTRLEPQGACRSRLFAFQMLCEGLGLAAPFARAALLDEAYWSGFLEAIVPHPGAMALLARCAEARVPVCVVTDMTAHVQIRKLARLGLEGLVAQLVTSEEVGAEKPDQRLFHEGLRKLGAEPQAAVMLGDSFEKDVKGALACGIPAGLIDLAQEG